MRKLTYEPLTNLTNIIKYRMKLLLKLVTEYLVNKINIMNYPTKFYFDLQNSLVQIGSTLELTPHFLYLNRGKVKLSYIMHVCLLLTV